MRRLRRRPDGARKVPLVLVVAAAGLGASQGARIASRGVTTYTLGVLGAALLLVLSATALAWMRGRREGSKTNPLSN
jgi:hypothetical protein